MSGYSADSSMQRPLLKDAIDSEVKEVNLTVPVEDVPKGESAEAKIPTVGCCALFRFATCWDVVLMLIGILTSAASGGVFPLFSVIFGQLIDNGFKPGGGVDGINELCVWFLVLGGISFATSTLSMACWSAAAERQVQEIRARYIASILRQEIGFFDASPPGTLTARLGADTTTISEAIGEKVGQSIQLLSTFVTGLGVGLLKGWQMALMVLATGPLMAIAGCVIGTIMKMAKKQLDAYASAGAVAEEGLAAVRTVHAYNAQNNLEARYRVQLFVALQAGLKKGMNVGFSIAFIVLVVWGSFGFACWWGARLVGEGVWNWWSNAPWTAGDVIAVFFSTVVGAFAIGSLGPTLASFFAGRGAAGFLYSIIDRESAIDSFDKRGTRLEDWSPRIEFKHIAFEYPTRVDVPVFKKLSFVLEPGTTVAVVGPSGAGKSTIVQLLERFYDPARGQILVNGTDLRSLNLRWWRQQLGLVMQEPILFSASIRSNIKIGAEQATEEEVIEAAKAANAHNFIAKLPLGYDTMVDNVQLSGGQKQRVCIARALLRRPRVLLLDEATSALDSESEKVVQEALDRVMKQVTTIVIAHRLSTIRHADKILVVRDGEVVEEGAHEALMELKGVYHSLVLAQQLKDKQTGGVDERYETRVETAETARESAMVMSKGGAETSEERTNASFWRIMSLNAPEWAYLLVGSFCALLLGLSRPGLAYIITEMITALTDQDPETATLPWVYAFFGIGGLMALLTFGQTVCFNTSGEWLQLRLREMAFGAMLRQHVGWFDMSANNSGVLMTRLSSDPTLIKTITNDSLGVMLQNIFTLIGGLGMAFYYGWQLAIVILAAGPVLVGGSYLRARLVFNFTQTARERFEKASQDSLEAIIHVRTVCAFTSEPRVLENFTQAIIFNRNQSLKSAYINAVAIGFANASSFFVNALAFWYGAQLIQQGVLTFALVLRVFNAISMSLQGVGGGFGRMGDYSKALIAAKALFKIIDQRTLIDVEGGEKLDLPLNASIQFENVSFCYPNRPEVRVFDNLSLEIPGGKTVAIVGQSGSGKSTIMQLLERFYDPTAGRVLIAGQPLKQLDLKYFRSQLGLVAQEPVLFGGTLEANLRVGKNNATIAEIEDACRRANILDFILGLPSQFQTEVGNRGKALSGGQKQRVAVARAILSRPRVLLLDEATSALDSESERAVQAALDELLLERKMGNGHTTIVIAHRLSTVQNADLIIVLEDGVIREQGSHQQLLDANGIYSRLVHIQQA